jgi:hypothetical protein
LRERAETFDGIRFPHTLVHFGFRKTGTLKIVSMIIDTLSDGQMTSFDNMKRF